MLAIAPYLIEASTTAPASHSMGDSGGAEDEIWAALESYPVPFRRRLIALSPRSGSWALAVRVCEASVKSAAHKAGEALELAELALEIAERAPGEESWRARLKGYCWAHVANARRVANDHAGSHEAFSQAWHFWTAGADSDSELLPRWRIYDLEASLRRDQRRFAEALRLLEQARAFCGDDPFVAGRILLNLEHVLDDMGDTRSALAVLAEAAPFIEASGDARQIFALRFNMVADLCHLESYEEAARLLTQVHQFALGSGNELDLIRVVWLQSRVAAGLGQTEEAIGGLVQVRRDFTFRDMPYDAALAGLDLAVLLLKAGRTGEVKDLATAMGWIFKSKGIDREALGALQLFCNAARQEAATVELALRVIAEIEQARRSAPFPSLPGGWTQST